MRSEAHDRQGLDQLCRYITRPAIGNERPGINARGQVVLKLKTPWRDGATHIGLSPQAAGWFALCARTSRNDSKNIGIQPLAMRFLCVAVGRRVKSPAIDRRTWRAIQWRYAKKVV